MSDDLTRDVVEPIQVDDGKHTGVILDVEPRITKEGGYKYIDVSIAFKQGENEVLLKPSYPDIVSSGSKLGKLLMRFGIPIEPGTKIDLNALKEKKCQFMTNKEKGKNKAGDDCMFTKVLPETVKPIEE